MQSGLQVFFVGMSVYGWLSWTRSAAAGRVARRACGRCAWHLARRWCVTALSFASAQLLAAETHAAWPLLDSLTTVVQPARHLARGARETRKLAVLDRHRRSTGVPLLRARPAVPGAAQRVVHRASRPAASSPGAGACQRAGGAGMIAGDAAAARAGLRRRRSAVFAGAHRRRQGQSQFPGAHAPRPLRACASTKTRRRIRASIATRELALHTAAANAGIAPQVIYAAPTIPA